MSDWVKRISSLLNNNNSKKDSYQLAYPLMQKASELNIEEAQLKKNLISIVDEIADAIPTKHYNYQKIERNSKNDSELTRSLREGRMTDIQGTNETDVSDDDNVKALQKLRSLPRGSETQAESRIAAIKNLLGEKEIFKTLQILRWPKGIVCPRCHSSKVVRRDPPEDAPDRRHYYICLTCKGEGDPSDFDDFTGLPVGTLQGLRQWMLCWYLIGFCSMSQIARVLGLSVYEVTQIASFGSQITEIATDAHLKEKKQAKEMQSKDKSKAFHEKTSSITQMQEDYTRSASKQPLKPGYKSKK